MQADLETADKYVTLRTVLSCSLLTLEEGSKHKPEKWIQISQIQALRVIKYHNSTKIYCLAFVLKNAFMVQM